ncbi:MAG TPA: hypothetical protein PLK99_06255, partial [Burkholderiales bacterium]|nr:hypothetical protein [Burkholderiales bacterium]
MAKQSPCQKLLLFSHFPKVGLAGEIIQFLLFRSVSPLRFLRTVSIGKHFEGFQFLVLLLVFDPGRFDDFEGFDLQMLLLVDGHIQLDDKILIIRPFVPVKAFPRRFVEAQLIFLSVLEQQLELFFDITAFAVQVAKFPGGQINLLFGEIDQESEGNGFLHNALLQNGGQLIDAVQ